MSLTSYLANTFLFKNISEDDAKTIIESISPEIVIYTKKEEICSPSSYKKRVGFIISGECEVERIKHDGSAVPLNLLKAGDSFGIISVLSSEEEFPTKINSKKETKVVYISEEDTKKLIQDHPAVSQNIISFLAEKIIFLNKKIATFSEDGVVNKLASFLSNSYIKYGAEFQFNCKKTAESLSVGRASLYRAIACLSDENIIKLENKRIYILDPKGLERNTK